MARIDSPRNRRSQSTRTAILEETLRLFEERGPQAITMAAVADAAGVSRRGLYLHFASRGALIGALLEYVDDRFDLAASIRPVQEAPDAVSGLRAWARHVAYYHHRLAPLLAATERVAREDTDVQALYERARRTWYLGCRSLTDALVAEGRLDQAWTDETATDLLWSFMSGRFVVDLVDGRGWSTAELAERLALVAERSLVAPGPDCPAGAHGGDEALRGC